MKATIEHFLGLLKNEADLISNYFSTGQYSSAYFEHPQSFCADIDDDDFSELTDKLYGRFGIYLFVANKPINFTLKSGRAWNDDTIKGGKIKAKKTVAVKIKKGNVFYLGSCSKDSLMVRLREHFVEEESYYSLKLGHENRSWIKPSLTVYFFQIKKDGKPKKNMFSKEERLIILPAIEKQLHIKLSPIAGSSRA